MILFHEKAPEQSKDHVHSSIMGFVCIFMIEFIHISVFKTL